MKLLIDLDEEYVNAIDKIEFLVGGRTNRKLQLEIIKAIKNGKLQEQEPTTKNDLGVECMKKFDAINIIQDMHGLARADVISDAVNRIIAMPSVTPIRPKGQWIDHSDDGYVECPKCGSATNCDGNIADLHFCFSCGADMREVKE